MPDIQEPEMIPTYGALLLSVVPWNTIIIMVNATLGLLVINLQI